MAVTDERRAEIITKYTHGDCGVLAIALHQKTHLNLVAVSLITKREAWQHFAVQDAYEPDIYWDIRGRLDGTTGLYKSFYGTFQLVTDVTIAEIEEFYSCYGDMTGRKRESLDHFLELHPGLPPAHTKKERRARLARGLLVGPVGIEPATSRV